MSEKIKCPNNVLHALYALLVTFDALDCYKTNPFGNHGETFRGERFMACSLYECNFSWRDVRVCWRYYFPQHATINREMRNDEVMGMLRECMEDIFNHAAKMAKSDAHSPNYVDDGFDSAETGRDNSLHEHVRRAG